MLYAHFPLLVCPISSGKRRRTTRQCVCFFEYLVCFENGESPIPHTYFICCECLRSREYFTVNSDRPKKKGTEGIKCVYNIHRANLSCHSRAVNILHNSYNFYLHTRRRHRSFFFQYCVWLHSVNITENSRNLLCAVSVCFFFVIVISFNFELNGRKKNRL